MSIVTYIIAAAAVIIIAAATAAIIISAKKKSASAAADETEIAADEETRSLSEAEEAVSGEEEVISEDEICICCGLKKKAEGSDYCAACERKLLKTKIPVFGWIGGIVSVLFILLAWAQIFIVSAPAVQVIKGDMAAADEKWNSAYSEYVGVTEIIDEINGIVGNESPFVKSGCALKAKMVRTIEKAYSPLEAASSISTLFTAEEDAYVQKNGDIQRNQKMLDTFQSTYNAVTEVGGDMLYDGSSMEEIEKAFRTVSGKEGVDPVFLEYFICSASKYRAADDTERLLSDFKKLDDAANASGKDYSWLYYGDYTNTYLKSGDIDSAIALTEKIMEKNSDKYDAYLSAAKLYYIKGETEKADALIKKFADINSTEDANYVLQAVSYRYKGEYDKLIEFCKDAFETCDFVPELHRQLAIAYLLKGDYDMAYDEAYSAEENAYNLYYMGDSSGYTDELVNTVYACTALCKANGKGTAENTAAIDELLESYSDEEISTEAKALAQGKLTPAQVFTEGDYDLI